MTEVTSMSTAEVYMTDSVCRAAVERLVDREGLSRDDAARRAAVTVKPAPHNIAADDARLLLAPEAVLAEQQEAEGTMYGEWGRPVPGAEFEREARDEAAANRATEENEGVGPIPPHPDEAPDDRRTFTETGLMSQQDYDWLHNGGVHECGPLCDLVTRLQTRMEEEDRIPVQPPALSVEGVGCWKARFVVDTVPARGRTFMIHAFCGDVQAEIDEALRELEHFPTERLVVRRRGRQPYATTVVYHPRPRPGAVPIGFALLEDEAAQMVLADVSGLVERLASGEYRLAEAMTMEVSPSGIVSVFSPAQRLP